MGEILFFHTFSVTGGGWARVGSPDQETVQLIKAVNKSSSSSVKNIRTDPKSMSAVSADRANIADNALFIFMLPMLKT